MSMINLRRLRRNEKVRRMIRDVHLSVDDLIYPLFVVHGQNIRKEIKALPGHYHLSVDRLGEEIDLLTKLGIKAICLFGLSEIKDKLGSEAYDEQGIVQNAIRSIKEENKDIMVITDVCLCEYTHHGHCGILKDDDLDDQLTRESMAKIALSHARAGADVVAPSGVVDGQVGAVRNCLEANGFHQTIIMSYAVRYSSILYNPFFRSGTESSVTFGDKKKYQMDYANRQEALLRLARDVQDGADICMIQPAFFYLDIISKARERFNVPLAAFNVSGEYVMLKSAAQNNAINERELVLEVFTALKRAGADLTMTYFTKDLARYLADLK
jgi:porphobilinogen synthase